MAAALAGRRPVRLGARGAGAFPTESQARVLWGGHRRRERRAGAVAAVAEEQMEKLGYAPSARPFSAHVTVGG
jgi:2'-5' RNA ligase